ncbi:MAG: amidohydrolase family protein [Verrucomicrobia bacterium]|nr:amidohydrolase family protein [Verrucomicrobiota bacterium]
MALTRQVLFQGPPLPPQPLPAPPLVDLHVHTAGIGAGDSGCFVAKYLQQSYKFGIYLQAFGVTREEVAREGDGLLIRRISERLAQGERVGSAVILTLDGAVDPVSGELDREATEVYVPTEFVARETARFTNLLYGASINPHRRDALQRLDRAAAEGAVLVKWIPSIMKIDPSDECLVPFYDRMKHHGLPLLSHTGEERSFTKADDALADPERLRLPLQRGVVVIAAHVASTGANAGEPDLERLAKLMTGFPNLYADISSLTQVNKLAYLRPALTRPEFAGRLCHGSDFPLMNTALVSPWFFPLDLTREQMETLAAIGNPWDRDVALKQALGVPPEVFQRSATLLRNPATRRAASHP